MIEDLKVIIDNHGLFLMLFFSGVLFGVVAQKMIDNQPVKPYIKRIAVAGMTMAIALSLNKVVGHFNAGFLYPSCAGIFRRSYDGNNQSEKIRNQQRISGASAGKARICQEEG